jgi:hypothetical protein
VRQLETVALSLLSAGAGHGHSDTHVAVAVAVAAPGWWLLAAGDGESGGNGREDRVGLGLFCLGAWRVLPTAYVIC